MKHDQILKNKAYTANWHC